MPLDGFFILADEVANTPAQIAPFSPGEPSQSDHVPMLARSQGSSANPGMGYWMSIPAMNPMTKQTTQATMHPQ